MVDRINEEKEKTVEAIVNLLPFEIPTVLDNSEDVSDQVYEELAEVFEQRVSPEGKDEFIAATNEINSAYMEECSGTGSSDRSDITELAQRFQRLTGALNRISSEELKAARALYGRFLCLYEKDKEDTTRERRQIEVDVDECEPVQSSGLPVTPTECCCPKTITQPCHFFCLHYYYRGPISHGIWTNCRF